MAILCFVPFIIVIFASKNSKLNTKEKWIAAAVAIVALLIGVFSSIDYHPVSQEDVDPLGELLDDVSWVDPKYAEWLQR